MDGAFIDQLRKHLSKPMEIGGKLIAPNGWNRHRENIPAPLHVTTLQGFVDYVTANRDGLALGNMTAHVNSPEQVTLVGPIIFEPHENADDRRICHCAAEFIQDAPLAGVGTFLDTETFVINLLTNFEDSGDHARVLELVSSLRASKARDTNDDGYAQEVIAKSGIATVAQVEVQNPVVLQPYRTFPDVFQPTSPFILRFRGGNEDAKPLVALFPADNGKWKLDAIHSISSFLRTNLPKEVAIIA